MFAKHNLENKVLCQVGSGPPGLFSLEPVAPTDAKNKPTFSVCLPPISLLKKVCYERGRSVLLVHEPLVAPHGAHWDWQQEVSCHMPHLGPFTFSQRSFKVGSEKRFVI